MEEAIVKKICEIMNVKYSHYDNHKMSKEYFPHYKLDSIPKIVVYSGMSPWQFTILEDMSIVTPMSPFNETLMELRDIIPELPEEKRELLDSAKDEMERIKIAEKYLKDNKCSLIINDESKPINF